jgi:drug/metabolite transporter (DMT)-like permease
MPSLLSALRWRGASFALLSAVLFGASTPVAKLLLGDISPWMLAGLLYLGSGVGLGLVRGGASLLGFSSREAPLRKADLPWLAAVVVIGGIIAPVLLMAGLRQTDASVAALLLNLEGLATMAIAWLVFHENVDRRIFAGASAILLGGAILSFGVAGGSGETGWGAALIAAACAAWGIDNNLTRKLSSADPIQTAMTKGLVAGVVNVTLARSMGAACPSFAENAIVGAVGFLGYGVSIALFVLALRSLGTARTSAYFSTAPFIGAALAVVIFNEPVTFRLLAAAMLMGVGIYLHLVENHSHEHVHEPMTHEHLHWHDDHHQHQHGPDDPQGEPHSHVHRHERLPHSHPHHPDLHHRHTH